MNLDPDVVAVIALAALGLALIAAVLGLVANLRIRRLRRSFVLLQGMDGSDGTATFVEVIARALTDVETLRAEVADQRGRLRTFRGELADAIRHLAVVRYDAFNDMGGRLSFSAAMLDDAGDGLVLTSINGRSETRTYAKGLKGGNSEAALSPEEEQVVGWAMRSVSAGQRSLQEGTS